MATEAKYIDGQSVLPQRRTVLQIEWQWSDGQSGGIPVGEYSPGVSVSDASAITKSMARTPADTEGVTDSADRKMTYVRQPGSL